MIRFKYIIWVCIGLCSPVFILAWTEADNIANTPERSNCPAITTDNNGDVYVVWSEDYLEIGKIFYTHYDGSSWSEPIDISRNELWWPLYVPAIEVDGTGRIHVVWDCNSSEIYWAYCDGDTWSIPVNISNTSGGSTGPRTAVDRYGRVHLVWHDNSTGRCEVYYSVYDGESWSGAQRITNGIGEEKNFWPDTDVDSSGYTHVVWGHYGGTGSELDYWIQYSRYNGISWTSPVDILRIEGKHMAEADIVIDIEDHPHVVAEKWNYNGIYYTRYNGETWSEPYLIYEGNHAGRPDIAIEPSNGLGCVVWGCRYYRFFNDTIWDSAGCIVGPDGVLPSLTAGIGTFHLVWASGDIWYSKHTVTGIESLEDSLQKEIELKSIPNPFDSGIMVQFALFEKIGVVIKVYNALGQEVKVLVNDLLCSGPYEVVWDGKDNLG
ncbi:hypothetical protein KAX35_08085, partial [candidate division WOR-3 bacterium]|nr:hypothetical protein [candidate division WOR-3 bacterium]